VIKRDGPFIVRESFRRGGKGKGEPEKFQPAGGGEKALIFVWGRKGKREKKARQENRPCLFHDEKVLSHVPKGKLKESGRENVTPILQFREKRKKKIGKSIFQPGHVIEERFIVRPDGEGKKDPEEELTPMIITKKKKKIVKHVGRKYSLEQERSPLNHGKVMTKKGERGFILISSWSLLREKERGI